MEVKDVFRNLVTNKYMANFDYSTPFTFKTVFYTSAYSYCSCTCPFQHEFVDYIGNNGNIDEAVYEKIVKSVTDGKCPHVTEKVQKEWIKETSLLGAHIAVAVGTEQAENALTAAAYRTPFMSAGIFCPKLHIIALVKRKLHRVKFHYQKDVQYNHTMIHWYTDVAVKTSNCNYVISKVNLLKGIAQTKNEKLLEDLMKLYLIFPVPMEFEAFHYVLKHGLTEVQDLFLYYFAAARVRAGAGVRPLGIHNYITDAITYNNPYVLDKLLQQAHSDKVFLGVLPRQLWCILCDIFKTPMCKEVLHKYGIDYDMGQKLDSHYLEDLLNLQRFHSADIKYISRALQKIPNIQEMCKEYVHSYIQGFSRSAKLSSDMVEMFLDLNVFTGKNGTFKDKYNEELFKTFVEISLGTGHVLYVRETALIMTKTNLDLDMPESIVYKCLCGDTLCFGPMMKLVTTLEGSLQIASPREFQTDTQEHGCFGYEGADFALNFTAPFLLECGFSTTREDLQQNLEDNELHPTEHAYLKNYIQENFDGPRPLAKTCRKVLRKHFQGPQIYKYLEVSHTPKKIKNFILMNYLLK